MILLPSILSFTAAGLLATTAVPHIIRGERRPQKTLFILSVILLAVSEISLGIMLKSRSPGTALVSFRVLLSCAIIFPALGIPFFIVFGKRNDVDLLKKHFPWFIAMAILVTGAAFALPAGLFVREIHFLENGPFWGMTFSAYGKALCIYLLLANVFFLFSFENTYRSATIPEKVTLKYPLLGILTLSVLNFIILSRFIVVSVIDKNLLAAHSCGIITFCFSFLYATFRYKLFNVNVYIGRRVVTSVFAIVVSGLYLLALALISQLAVTLGLPYNLFTFTVLGIFAVFLLLAVLVSGKAKKRLRKFINENFYLTRYDYRKEWRHYAELLASNSSLDEFCTNVISSLCPTMLVQRGLIWINMHGGIAAYYGFADEKLGQDELHELQKLLTGEHVKLFKKSRAPLLQKKSAQTHKTRLTDWVRAVARLGPADEVHGFIALGEKDLHTPYTEEDDDFLATIADQATLTLENLLLEERVMETRQVESFNRFASFVVHDLKNAVGMLSLTAENAKDNIGNIEFQNDAIETIYRSVDKMKGLISLLNTFKEPASISKMDTEVSTMIAEVVDSLGHIADSKNVSLRFESHDAIRAHVDRSAIKRVVENLVLNALDAVPTGGTVTVEAESVDAQWLNINIRDTGPDFDPDYLKEHLFYPFRSTKTGGLGIGLVLCKSLVEAHGGTLSIEPNGDCGALVAIHLPSY